jgi:hypothetical protein
MSSRVINSQDLYTAGFEGVADSWAATRDISVKTGTSYTLQQSDATNILRMDNANPISITVPDDSADISISSLIEVHQVGVGVVTFVAASGVTIQSRDELISTAGQFSVCAIRKVAANTWILTGDLS